MPKRLDGRYLAWYWAVFAAVAGAAYLVPSGLAEASTAAASDAFLRLFGLDSRWWVEDGVTIIVLSGVRSVVASVVRECTALNVFGVIAGLVIPLRAPAWRRLLAVAASGFSLFLLNVPRIALTVYLTAYDVWPFTMLPGSSLETYHYPISFAFGVLGVALVVLGLTRWVVPELGETLVGVVDWVRGLAKRGGAE